MSPESRQRRLGRRLEEAGFDALLVISSGASDPDLAPFVGPVHLGASFLIVGKEPRLGFLTPMERDEAASTGLELLTPESLEVASLGKESSSDGELWAALLARALAAAELVPGRVALAGRYPAGTVFEACRSLERAGWSFSSGHELLRELRKPKTETELVEMRRVTVANCAAFRRVAEVLASSTSGPKGLSWSGAPLTAGTLRGEIAQLFARERLEQPHGNIVAAGADAGVPHTQGGSERQLRPNESIVVDLYPKGQLFSDCTRTFCVGEAPSELSHAHRAVLTALEAAHGRAQPGASGWELQRQTCEALGAAGYPTPLTDPDTTRGYVHGLGHGVGFELHEYPSFRADRGVEGKLAVGDVLTLEPGLYEPELGFGVRLEDLCYLGPRGLEILTELPYELDPRAWVSRPE